MIIQTKEIEVSVIIVHYKVKEELFDCLTSIEKSKPKVSYEIIVVDNDEVHTIKQELKRKFPTVIYKENKNTGWGGGTNVGVSIAKGKYIFFLNPDSIVTKGAIDTLHTFIESKKKVGVASALLLNKDRKPYPLQGTGELTPLSGLICLSLINTIFPKNPISEHFWHAHRSNTKSKSVPVAPLSASLIRRDVFEQMGRFDEKFFLYFEEYDLSMRLLKNGYTSYIIPEAKVVHFWEASSKKRNDIKSIFSRSREYYFEKYYGKIPALLINRFILLKPVEFVLLALFVITVLVIILFRIF